ncbi:MAG TPA: M12 family metallo-peptidase, partial [Pyrinomonadaceae bacterium]|nr:M12 family metallo-peptidase [Pyrinomonadaceae bacterium]
MRNSHRVRRLLTVVLLIIPLGLFALDNAWPANQPAAKPQAQGPVNSNSSAPASLPPAAQESDIPWRESSQKSTAQQQRVGAPIKSRSVTLDPLHLEALLRKAPLESTATSASAEASISLPMPDGSYMRFHIQESPVMEPALAARYPNIRTFRGQAVDGQAATTRFDWTPQGFHAMLLTPRGTVLIEPAQLNQTSEYISYFQGDTPGGTMECQVDGLTQDAAVATARQTGPPEASGLVSSGSSLRTYRLAVAATAEYTQTFGGGTVNGALAAITTTVNMVNAIFERDVAVRMVLIANETSIIFTDTASDGYTTNTPTTLISENQSRIDAIIGSANYDIGHVFDGQQSVSGFSFQGIASLGVVCRTALKARGVSIIRGLQPSSGLTAYNAAHEMGHQFGAAHTFNATSGTCGAQRSPSTAYEPGTGSTIMGYRFACAPEDLMSADNYFHNASLEQIVAYITTGNGSSCPTITPTGNNIPTVDAGPSFTIPRSTPFQLTATGSDADNDPLTYTWEQFDLGAAGPPNTDDGSRPLFRSNAPASDPARLFPSLINITCAFCPTLGQEMATTTRTLNFRAVARDNRSGGGAVSSDSTQVNVRSEIGPFTVNGQEAEWTVKSQRTVTWNVANTTSAPVSCSTVKISMSLDQGTTFPIILAASTPNDGSETVTIPGTPASSARIKVEAVGNVFFNLSPALHINGVEDIVPTISNVSPGSGAVGTVVTINGTNFISPNAVRFNGVDASFTVNSTTQIVATVPGGASTGLITVLTNGGTATSSTQFTLPSGTPTVQLATASNFVGENAGFLIVTVNRSGDVSAPATVNFATSDTAGLQNCTIANGRASERCDYATTIGTLRFAAGEASKPIVIPLVNDVLVEGDETFTLRLTSPTGAVLGTAQTTVTIDENDFAPATQNPIDGVDPFVTQQYIDFLGRLPDSIGFANWVQTLGNCPNNGNGEFDNPHCDRVHVSSGFFLSVEFQGRGYFAYRFYEVALDRRPTYAEFVPDMAQV